MNFYNSKDDPRSSFYQYERRIDQDLPSVVFAAGEISIIKTNSIGPNCKIKTENGLLGLEYQNKETIPCIYSEIIGTEYSENVIIRDIYGYYGIANKQGKILIEPQYQDVSSYKHLYIFKIKEGHYALVSQEGKVLVEDGVYCLSKFNNASFMIAYFNYDELDKFMLFSEECEMLSDESYRSIEYIKDYNWFVCKGENSALILNANGTNVFEKKIEDCYVGSKETYYSTQYFSLKTNGRFNLMNSDKNIIIPNLFEDIRLTTTYIYYLLEGKWGLMDFDLNIIVNNNYKKFYEHEDCINAVNENGTTVYNLKGEKLLEADYPTIFPLKGDYYTISDKRFDDFSDSKYGVINKNGEVIVPCEYDQIETLGNFIKVSIHEEMTFSFVERPYDVDEEHGLYDLQGRLILECEYYEIKIIDGKIRAKLTWDDEEFYWFDFSGNPIGKGMDIRFCKQEKGPYWTSEKGYIINNGGDWILD